MESWTEQRAQFFSSSKCHNAQLHTLKRLLYCVMCIYIVCGTIIFFLKFGNLWQKLIIKLFRKVYRERWTNDRKCHQLRLTLASNNTILWQLLSFFQRTKLFIKSISKKEFFCCNQEKAAYILMCHPTCHHNDFIRSNGKLNAAVIQFETKMRSYTNTSITHKEAIQLAFELFTKLAAVLK